GGPAALSADARRSAPARTGAAQRGQSRHVYADRQLQSRSGSRQGHHRKADAVTVWSIAFSPLVPMWALILMAALALAASVVLVLRGVRGAWLRALAFGLLFLGL